MLVTGVSAKQAMPTHSTHATPSRRGLETFRSRQEGLERWKRGENPTINL